MRRLLAIVTALAILLVSACAVVVTGDRASVEPPWHRGEGPHRSAFQEIRFAQLSDTHIELKDSSGVRRFEESVELLREAVELINQMELDFVLISGDLINDGHTYNLDAAHDVLSELEIPCYIVLGNNDVPLIDQDEQISRFEFVYAFQGSGFEGNLTYWSTDVAPGVHLVGLDLTKPGTGEAYLPRAELKWLEADLRRNAHKLTIVLTHQPLVQWDLDPESKGEILPELEELYELFSRFDQVAFVLSGHYHQTRIYDLGGFFQIVSPQLISYPHAFRVYRLGEKTMEMSLRQVGDPDFLARSRKLVIQAIRARNPGATEEDIERILSVYEPPSWVANAVVPVRW